MMVGKCTSWSLGKILAVKSVTRNIGWVSYIQVFVSLIVLPRHIFDDSSKITKCDQNIEREKKIGLRIHVAH